MRLVLPVGNRAFSLVEVAIALGVMAVALVAIIGLLPAGLNTQHLAQESSRAVSALNLVSSAAESLRQNTADSWAFPTYLSDDANPSNNPTIVTVGSQPWDHVYFINDDGLIIPQADTTTSRRETLYLRVFPPAFNGRPVRIYAAIAWPCKPTDTIGTTPTQMTDRQGFLDTMIAFTPNPAF